MTLHQKTLTVLGIASLFLIGSLSLIVIKTFLGNFEQLEGQHVLNNLSRAQKALSAEISQLHRLNADWACWDDSYAFIEDLNEKYVKSNLGATTHTTQRLNFILFINKAEKVVAGNAFDLENNMFVEVRKDLIKHLEGGRLLFEQSLSKGGLSGILRLDEDLMLVSSQPILTSQRKGPARGVLIMGRYLNKHEIEILTKQVELPLSIHMQNQSSEMQLDGIAFKEQADSVVRPLNNNIIAGYAPIMDIYNKPAAIMKIEEARLIYEQGVKASHFVLYAIIVVIVVFMLLIVFVLQKVVLKPISRLVKGVRGIGQEGELSIRLPYLGGNEIGNLANTINKMLGVLEDSQKEKEKLIADLQKALSEVKTLSGMLPICSSCKKVRDDKGYWNQIENYILENSEAELTHGICPECQKKLYPEFCKDE